MKTCYAECEYNCIEEDTGWSDTVNLFCNHPNNNSAQCILYDLMEIANLPSFSLQSLLFHGAYKKEWIDFKDYIKLINKKGNCQYLYLESINEKMY